MWVSDEGSSERAAVEFPVVVSAAMQAVVSSARDVAQTDTTVVLLGESGTGKELIARLIHAHSARAAGPFVLQSCATGPVERLEKELFGFHTTLGITVVETPGRFEQARGGTLVLDEVSELPLPAQAKVLRVLQDRELQRTGDDGTISRNFRLIVTSSQDLRGLVAAGRFRPDLYYRLCVYPIVIPPLRDRPSDIAALANHFVQHFALEMGRPPPVLSPSALAALQDHVFGGNVRELRNVVERLLIRCREPVAQPTDLLLDPPVPVRTPLPIAPSKENDSGTWALPIDLGELERLAITEALRRVGGNRTHAARLLGISLRTLRNKLRLWRQMGQPFLPMGDADSDAITCQERDTTVARSSQRNREEQAA